MRQYRPGVTTELFFYVGSLPAGEAEALVSSSDEELKKVVGPKAQTECGLSEEQVSIIIDETAPTVSA